jgi:hypothetical protein
MLKEDEDDQAADPRAAPIGIRTFGLRKREKNEQNETRRQARVKRRRELDVDGCEV